MYRDDKHEKHDQQDSADARVQARRALQAAYDWRDDERLVGEVPAPSASRREYAAATPAPSESWTATV
jgi:hypothetical protein